MPEPQTILDLIGEEVSVTRPHGRWEGRLVAVSTEGAQVLIEQQHGQRVMLSLDGSIVRALPAPAQDDPPPVLSDGDDAFTDRLLRIQGEIELGMACDLRIGHDDEHTPGRYYFQIRCWRQDTITKEMGYGYGGKAYLSPHATDSELIQTAFGLFKGYWEHEARETFIWRGRRPFGPHISTEALWEVARRVDVRSARHVEDRGIVEGVRRHGRTAHDVDCEGDFGPDGQESPCRCAERRGATSE